MTTFVPNPLFERELLASTVLDPPLADTADEIATKARGIAPVDTGTYRDSIQVITGHDGGEPSAAVYSDVEYAPFLEFGTSDTPTFAVFRRASESA